MRAIEIHVVAGPELGDARLLRREAKRRGRSDRDFLERDAGTGRPLSQRCEDLGLAAGDDPELLFRGRLIAVAGMAEQSAQMQPGQRCDRADELQRCRRLRIDAASMKADVNLDEHIKDATGATHRLRPPPRDGQVIDDDRERGALHQGEHAGGVRRIHRIGQPDVVDAGRRHHLGFADLGAADPGRAPLDLPPRDRR